MRKSLFLLLAGAACCGAASAWAQAPAPGLMPDGSYDMYAGLGVRSAPNYEGGNDRKVRAMPVLQVGWSNGVFISGMSAGWHLSATPGVEYGPLLSLHGGRGKDGSSLLDTADKSDVGNMGIITLPPGLISAEASAATDAIAVGAASMAGSRYKVYYHLRNIGARAEGGFFFNYYLADRLRLTNSVLYGAGEDRHGLRWIAELQRGAIELAPHHTLSLTAGMTVGNRTYNTGYFGLRTEDVLQVTPIVMGAAGGKTGAAPVWAYAAAGGVKDIHLGARWNWALSPSWLLTTNVQITQLRGGAKHSPLTDRATGVSVSTALAYRF